MHVCIRMHAHMQACMHARTHAHIHVYARRQACMHTHAYACMQQDVPALVI